MQTDFIIVGQGISGTLLSHALIAAGQRVLVIDEAKPVTASKIASGLINPVTGKKYVTTWLADTLLPFAKANYTQLGQQFNQTFIREYDLLSFHPTREAAAHFEAREQEDDTYLYYENKPGSLAGSLEIPFGIGGIHPCYLVDVAGLIKEWRAYLISIDALQEAPFTLADLSVSAGHVSYKGITAGRIIFCAGAADIDNPYFTRLNFQLNKGEALIASIPGLARDRIYKHGPVSIIPWGENTFWIGSTFDRDYTDDQPTPAFRNMAETMLAGWLKLPFTIMQHVAAIRPATGGQKPFIGLHPLHPAVGIFNGMGSKGCSLAPYFAHQLTEHLLQGTPLTPEADIQRFAKILSR